MTAWAWAVLWLVLVAGAGFVFFRIGRSLWRKAQALLVELGEASERLSAVSAELNAVMATTAPEEPAVFADPTQLRQERYLAARSAARGRDHGRGRGERGRGERGRGRR